MRDKLIALINENRACPEEDGYPCEKCVYDTSPSCFVDRLADVLIANGVTLQQWIPVSERLPEKSGKYLVRYELWGWGKLFSQWTGLCFFYDEISQFIDDGGPVMGRITHWMPLPEAPKEGE